MHELTVGQKVICKHKNGRYYQCDVVQLSKETFYEVNFDDGSFSDNLFPEDIVVRPTTVYIFSFHKEHKLVKHLRSLVKETTQNLNQLKVRKCPSAVSKQAACCCGEAEPP